MTADSHSTLDGDDLALLMGRPAAVETLPAFIAWDLFALQMGEVLDTNDELNLEVAALTIDLRDARVLLARERRLGRQREVLLDALIDQCADQQAYTRHIPSLAPYARVPVS